MRVYTGISFESIAISNRYRLFKINNEKLVIFLNVHARLSGGEFLKMKYFVCDLISYFVFLEFTYLCKHACARLSCYNL